MTRVVDTNVSLVVKYPDEHPIELADACAQLLEDILTGMLSVATDLQGEMGPSTLRDELAADLGIVTTPCVGAGRFNEADILRLLGTSRLGSQPMEGVVLRIEQTDRVVVRAKVVRSDFVQSIEKHWTTNEREPNRRATSG